MDPSNAVPLPLRHPKEAEDKGETALPELAIFLLALLLRDKCEGLWVANMRLATPEPAEKRSTGMLRCLLAAIEHPVNGY